MLGDFLGLCPIPTQHAVPHSIFIDPSMADYDIFREHLFIGYSTYRLGIAL